MESGANVACWLSASEATDFADIVVVLYSQAHDIIITFADTIYDIEVDIAYITFALHKTIDNSFTLADTIYDIADIAHTSLYRTNNIFIDAYIFYIVVLDTIFAILAFTLLGYDYNFEVDITDIVIVISTGSCTLIGLASDEY